MISPPPLQVPIATPLGGLSSAWLAWFDQLRRIVSEEQGDEKNPNAASALASYDALLRTIEQLVQTQPSSGTPELQLSIDNLRQTSQVGSYAGFAELSQQLDALRQEVQTTVRFELGTLSQLQQANLPWTTFDTTPDFTPPDVGTVAWDGGTTLGIQMTANVLQRVGETEFVYAKASATITKGQLCYHTGAVGSSGVITAAPTPIGLTDPNQIVGVAAESIALNDFGLIQISGDLRGFDTTGSSVGETWADGDPLYYNPAYVGRMTNVKPVAPNQKSYIGEVINAGSSGSGSMHIRIVQGSVLGGTDSNVQFTTLADKDLIQYDSVLGYWKNITHFFLDATNKRMGINVPSPSTTLVINANASTSPPTPLAGTVFDSHGANGSANRLAINSYGGAPALTFVRSSGTMASPTAVASGDAIGVLAGTGYNGSAYTAARASILYYAAETWTTTANGTEIRLVTTPLGSATPAERFKIGPAGQFGPVVAGVENYGLSGQVLTSGGASAQPSWQTPQGTPTLNVVTGTTQAAVANNHYVLTNVATSTLTLPATPTAGDVVWVTVGNGLTTNVVARNGSNIQGLAEDMTLNARYAAVQMRYINSTIGWTFV